MEKIKVVILPGGKTAREVNPSGNKYIPVKNCGANFNGGEEYCECKKQNQWQSAEDKRRTFEIDYPKITVHDLIWGENRYGKPVQYKVVYDSLECDIECEISIENVDQDMAMIYLIGKEYSAKILENSKIRII